MSEESFVILPSFWYTRSVYNNMWILFAVIDGSGHYVTLFQRIPRKKYWTTFNCWNSRTYWWWSIFRRNISSGINLKKILRWHHNMMVVLCQSSKIVIEDGRYRRRNWVVQNAIANKISVDLSFKILKYNVCAGKIKISSIINWCSLLICNIFR